MVYLEKFTRTSSYVSLTGRYRLTAMALIYYTVMREFKSFYWTPEWKICREAYKKQARGLCEVCLSKGIYKPGEIVHHKVHITADNVNDPSITLSFNNLRLVCRDCHADIHKGHETRYKVDELGRVVTK